MKADMNTLQKHIETQPVTDPNPASIRKLTLGEVLRIDSARRHNVRKNWLRRFLGRFLAKCGAFWR